MKKRDYKRIYRPGTLFRVVRRCAVKTYWAVMREVIARREEAPKFSPGDWITEMSTGRYDLVESYSNGYYACENSGFPKLYEVGYRRWNINDARPGNVLFYHPTRMAFIFKGIEGDDRKLKLFCSCNTEASDQPGAFQLYDEDEYFGRADDFGIIPANNKQRRTLFNKMQSEGYDLDFGKDGQLMLVKIRNNGKEDPQP